MKIYSGKRINGVCVVSIRDFNGTSYLTPQRSQRHRNHSPDGFNWGYGGTAPAQLALAILLDAFGSAHLAQKWYQPFKWHWVSAWGEEWEISKDVIQWWIESEASKAREAGEPG